MAALANIAIVHVPVSVNGSRGHIDVALTKKSAATGFVSVNRSTAERDAQVIAALMNSTFLSGLNVSLKRKANILLTTPLNTQAEADVFVETAERELIEALGTLEVIETPKRGRRKSEEAVEEAAEEVVSEVTEEAVEEAAEEVVSEVTEEAAEEVVSEMSEEAAEESEEVVSEVSEEAAEESSDWSGWGFQSE